MGGAIKEIVAPRAESIGLALSEVSVRDLILPAEVRQLFAEAVGARQRGQTALQVARDEVAATRALLNAARLMREHPELMRLKELQTLAQIAERQGQLVITPLGSTPVVAVAAETD